MDAGTHDADLAQPTAATAAAAHAAPSDGASRAAGELRIPALGESSLMGELPTTDPLSMLVSKHLPVHLRPVRDLSGQWPSFSVSGSSEGVEGVTAEAVEEAVAMNAWRKIASLCRSTLEAYSRACGLDDEVMRVEEVLQWWSIRLYSLARLRLYSMLRTELAGLWDVLTTENGGVVVIDRVEVPFGLLVLRATEPKYRGEARTTVEQYTLLIRMCKQRAASQPTRAEVWKSRALRVATMLATTLAEGKDYNAAIDLLDPLLDQTLHAKEDVGDRVGLVVVAARIWIQAGDTPTALSLLQRASTLLDPQHPGQLHIHHAKSLIDTIDGNLNTSTDVPNSNAAKPNEVTMMQVVENLNAAVRLFYQAQLDSAIGTLDQQLHHHPALIASADPVVFNAATLYELAAGAESHVVARKRDLLATIARWAPEPGPSNSTFKL